MWPRGYRVAPMQHERGALPAGACYITETSKKTWLISFLYRSGLVGAHNTCKSTTHRTYRTHTTCTYTQTCHIVWIVRWLQTDFSRDAKSTVYPWSTHLIILPWSYRISKVFLSVSIVCLAGLQLLPIKRVDHRAMYYLFVEYPELFSTTHGIVIMILSNAYSVPVDGLERLDSFWRAFFRCFQYYDYRDCNARIVK